MSDDDDAVKAATVVVASHRAITAVDGLDIVDSVHALTMALSAAIRVCPEPMRSALLAASITTVQRTVTGKVEPPPIAAGTPNPKSPWAP